MSRQDTTILLRAVAITAVVLGHFGLQPYSGGALFLLALAGFNFVKFTIPKISDTTGNLAEPLLRYGWKLYLPTALYIFGISFLTGQLSWTPLLMLTEALEPGAGGIGYWFIEVLLQIYLVFGLILIFAPKVRQVMLRTPFKFFATATITFFIVRLLVLTFVIGAHPNELEFLRLPHLLAFTYFVGAMAAVAQTSTQKVITSATIGAICAESLFTSFGDDFTVFFFGMLIVLWLPTISLPKVIVPTVNTLAFSSLFIYLSHFQVESVFEDRFTFVPAEVQALIALGVGIAMTKAWKSRLAIYEYLVPTKSEPLKRWA